MKSSKKRVGLIRLLLRVLVKFRTLTGRGRGGTFFSHLLGSVERPGMWEKGERSVRELISASPKVTRERPLSSFLQLFCLLIIF